MKRIHKTKKLILSVVLTTLMASLMPSYQTTVLAQATTGVIRGLVTDQAGAVVSGATVVAKNQKTGVQSPVFKTSGDGLYSISSLNPGTYTITVESSNFKRAEYTDIEVTIGQPTVIDVTLQPGGVSETVSVTATTETSIQKDSSQVSTSFTARQVADLPSNVAGNGIDTLALLVPGVTPGFGGATNTNGTSLSVNGNRTRANNFSIDGQDNNDLSIGGPSFFVSNQDQIADFQVITNNFSAQYGRNQGAIVNIVTKSGTNDFHGTGFLFHRDRKLFETLTNKERIATNPDGSRAFTEAPPLLYNVYGGTVGGPIIKNRAFFFGSYQGIKTREDFIARSGFLAILPEEFPRLLRDFPNNPIAEAISKYSVFAINDFGTVRPRTDLADPFDTITIGGHTYRAAFPERQFKTGTLTPTDQDEFSGRFDLKISEKDNFWARYLFQNGNVTNGVAQTNGFTGDVPFRSQNLGADYIRQVSSQAINDFRFAYTRLFVNFGGGCDSVLGCIPDPKDIGNAITNISFGNIVGDNTFAPLQTIGVPTGFPQGRSSQVYQFTDDFRLTRGRHQFLAGVDIHRILSDSTFFQNFNGQFNVNTAGRFINNSPFRVSLAVGEPQIKFNETDQFYYFQDDWRVRDNLTLNLGVRYEYTGQPINRLHDLTVARESDPSTALWLQSLPLEARVAPKIASDKNNFAPRFGFAYTPRFWKKVFGDNTTVFRGGYSIAYEDPFYNIITNVQASAPFAFTNLTSNPATPTGANPVLFPVPSTGFTGNDVRALAQSLGVVRRNTFDPTLSATLTTVAPDFRSPYSEQWSFGMQRQIGRSNVVEVRYLGTHGVGLFQSVNANPRIDQLINGFTIATDAAGSPLDRPITFPGFPNLVPPGVTPLTCVDNPATASNEGICNGRLLREGRETRRQNSAQSIYHSLQSRYSGRLFNQFTFGAAYTFSKLLDNATEIFGFVENSLAQDPLNITGAERAYSGLDRRHVLALNGIWDIPAYKEQKGVLGHLLGGWQMNGTYNVASGQRYTAIQGAALNLFTASYIDP
jgi:outer membrane receptor protein involved in Fe transport